MYVFLQILSTMNKIDHVFLSHIVSTISDQPEKVCSKRYL